MSDENNFFFEMAEDPAEDERMFAAMSRDDLVRNCTQAAGMVRLQVQRADINAQRAERCTALGRKFESHCAGLFELIGQIRKLATTGAAMRGPGARQQRLEILQNIASAADVEKVDPVKWPDDCAVPSYTPSTAIALPGPGRIVDLEERLNGE